MHKSNWCFKLELEWTVFSFKKARKLFKKEKSCTKSEKLLQIWKVAQNRSKVAEQLMDSPTPLWVNTGFRGIILSSLRRRYILAFPLWTGCNPFLQLHQQSTPQYTLYNGAGNWPLSNFPRCSNASVNWNPALRPPGHSGGLTRLKLGFNALLTACWPRGAVDLTK